MPPRLARIHDIVAGYVERGAVPAIVSLVSRHGEVHVEAIGTKHLASLRPKDVRVQGMRRGCERLEGGCRQSEALAMVEIRCSGRQRERLLPVPLRCSLKPQLALEQPGRVDDGRLR